MGGKVAKAWSLAGFLKIENSSGSRGALLKWLPLWRPCLPKIYRGGPEDQKITIIALHRDKRTNKMAPIFV